MRAAQQRWSICRTNNITLKKQQPKKGENSSSGYTHVQWISLQNIAHIILIIFTHYTKIAVMLHPSISRTYQKGKMTSLVTIKRSVNTTNMALAVWCHLAQLNTFAPCELKTGKRIRFIFFVCLKADIFATVIQFESCHNPHTRRTFLSYANRGWT